MKPSRATTLYFAVALVAIVAPLLLGRSPAQQETVPRIDVSRFFNGTALEREQVLREWDHAMHSYGFVVITGHGVPAHTWENLRAATIQFGALPEPEKLRFSNPADDICKGGYTPFMRSNAAKSYHDASYKRDMVERIQFEHADRMFDQDPNAHDDVHKGPHVLRAAIEEYYHATEVLKRKIYRLSALSLGIHENALLDALVHDNDTAHVISVNHYPAISKAMRAKKGIEENAQGIQARVGAHTDFQGLTLLKPDPMDATFGTLEVLSQQTGNWVKVFPQEGDFVINTGDFFNVWTNGHWISNFHRVVISEEVATREARVAFAGFTGPPKGAFVRPLAHTKPFLKYHTITALYEKCQFIDTLHKSE